MEKRIDEYLKHFGDEFISKEIEEYAVEVALKHSRYVFTKRRGKKQFGYCTYCKSEFETPGLKHKEKYVCPNCNSEVEVRASGISRKYMFDEAYFIFFEKSKVDKGVVIAKGIWADKSYKEDYKESIIKYKVNALYIFEIGNPVMLINWSWDGDIKYFRTTSSCYPVNVQSFNASYNTNLESLESSIKGTPYQYSMYKEYCQNENVIRYLELYSKYPRIEDLTKLGFSELIETKLWKEQTYSSINWNGKSVFKMLRLNRDEFKKLREYEGRKSPCFVKLVQINTKEKNKLSLNQLKDLERIVASDFTNFKTMLKYASLYKVNKYVMKQEKNYINKFHRGLLGVISDWKDYIEDCKKLNMNIKDDSIMFPPNLYEAHQNTIKKIKYKENKALDEKIKKREPLVNAKYLFEDSDYIIRAAESSKEIIDEGTDLHHCVGGYTKKHAEGETNILFIRKKNNIDKPYFTMEIRNNKIIQIRGIRNCEPDKMLSKFIDKFKRFKIEKVKNKNVA